MSWTPVAVTVCAALQFCVVKVSDGGDAVPSPASRLDTDTVTAAEGCVRSATVKVDAPPASVAWPVTEPTSSPNSLSELTAYTVTAESAS